jgi:hypothetical protein
MQKARAVGFFVLVFSALMTVAAMADDWVAVKLRGAVFAFVDGSWVQLHRGDVVPDDRVVRTQPSGRVTFARGAETIDLGPSTQIQIFDKNGKRFTTVRQFYGRVEIEAEAKNVLHFGVRTPYLAAVVKGTKFIVQSDKDSSDVSVMRGKVAVENFQTHKTVLLTAGQSIDSDNFVLVGDNGLPVLPGLGGGGGAVTPPPELFGGLGGGQPTVLDDLFGGSGGPAVDLGLGGSNGVQLSLGAGGLDLGADLGAVQLDLGLGGSGLDVGAGVGGASVNLGAGTGGVDVGVGLGGLDTGVSAGSGGVTVTTPVGGISLPLGGLL